MMDYLTRYLIAVPMLTTDANSVSDALVKKFILIYGIPQIILTDQGRNFMGEVFKKVCKYFKIKKINCSAYHPESNGFLERSHRTLKDYLRNFVDRTLKDWDELLPFAVFCHNTNINSATGYTPYELIFGKQAELPMAPVQKY